MSSLEGPPETPLTAQWLIWDFIVRFAREHSGSFDLVKKNVQGLRSKDALTLAHRLHELGCSIRLELRVAAPSLLTYELPPGA